jgi:hypothetical protein
MSKPVALACNHADEPRIVSVFNTSLRVQPLPVALFPGGHVAFVQHTPER